VNDYLARRDAQWMGDIYRFFGLSVGHVQREMAAGERRQAYARDVTYVTANEAGFDYLRDRMALSLEEQVHRPFGTALIDEADSILIDEARIPLVIAGGDATA
jgi:preprotein translocase subunit SecA